MQVLNIKSSPPEARWWLAQVLLLLLEAQLTVQLKLSAVHIPSLVQMGSNFWLSCQFELEPERASQEQLYSVKWYRNNEEFYRLMLVPESQATGGWQQHPEVGNPQQQYFAQSGINVMMSSSNATHVRLLNASLESEGIYACEISTQNLSTIRYEKNIRVYVLPHSKLNIIGFKNRYSLNDKVELVCQSDFSRPQPALAWFINGRRIGVSNQWLELQAANKSKLNESGNLLAASLSLKFKLTREFLAEYLSAANQRNQSQRKSSVQHLSPYQLQSQPKQPDPGQLELRIQCKYKLAEVSEVTFNELAIGGRAPRKWSAGSRKQAAGGQRQRRATRPEVRLNKSSSSHQVIQSKSPASARSLANFLQNHYYANLEQQCNLGSLALLPDDPVLVEVENLTGELEANDELQDDSPTELVADQSVGDSLSVDCSTVSGLLPTRVAQQRSWRMFRGQCEVKLASFSDGQATRRRLLQPISTTAGQQQYLNKNLMSPGTLDNNNNNNHNNGLANEEEDSDPVGPDQRVPPNQRQLLTGHAVARGPAAAYLWLDRPITPIGDNQEPEQRSPTPTTTTADSSTSEPNPLLAPPLLEWFINNQEAPVLSVVGYSPELPLLAAPAVATNQSVVVFGNRSRPHPASRASQKSADANDDNQGDQDGEIFTQVSLSVAADARRSKQGGTTGSSQDALPSVDSTEYFANFDSRPIEQKLRLNLKLDKKHFMTPDSTLKLKCTSTQARVLMADTATLIILPVVIKPEQQQSPKWQRQASKPKGQARASSKAHQKASPSNSSYGSSLPSTLTIIFCLPLAALSVQTVMYRLI